MSARTVCDHCGKVKDTRRMKHRVSMKVHPEEAAHIGLEQADQSIADYDICSDQCLRLFAEKRIYDRATRKASEAARGAEVTPTPLNVPPRRAVSACTDSMPAASAAGGT